MSEPRCLSFPETVTCAPLPRRSGIALSAVLLSMALAACTPLQTSSDAKGTAPAARVQGTGLHGSEQLAKVAPPAMRWDRMGDPAKAVENHLYELQWPEVDQQGMASWYGPGFHGRKTANGERFNQFDLTAAHPTYAFGTQLCVRSKATGQAVVVRVNDRGPFVKNRVIDLSKAAAEEIGMLDKGVKAVEIYKLDDGQEECPAALLQAQG